MSKVGPLYTTIPELVEHLRKLVREMTSRPDYMIARLDEIEELARADKPVNPPDVPEGSGGSALRRTDEMMRLDLILDGITFGTLAETLRRHAATHYRWCEGLAREAQYRLQRWIRADETAPIQFCVPPLPGPEGSQGYQRLSQAARSAQALCEMLLSDSDVPIADIQSVRDELKRTLEGK